jgi:GDP-mannose 6-dehydrogenase
MKISIFGLGYVGAVSLACLARDGHEVIGVDIDEAKLDLIAKGKTPVVEEGMVDLMAQAASAGRVRVTKDPQFAVAETDLSLVCVGTPSAPNGSQDQAAVLHLAREIGHAIGVKREPHVVVFRSTLVPGTVEGVLRPLIEEASGKRDGEGFFLCFQPEFLREGSSIRDYDKPPFTVVGANHERPVKQLYSLFGHLPCKFMETSVRSAEMMKYCCNNFHALKITFANETARLCEALGVDAFEVMNLVCQDTQLNISTAYLKPGFAFGGSCLPKDLRATTYLAKINDVEIPMLAAIMQSNREHLARALDKIVASGKRRIGFIGLSFKPGTDDLRESPLVSLAEQLIGKGMELAVYDPEVRLSQLLGANRRYIEHHLPHIGKLLRTDIGQVMSDSEVLVVGLGGDDVADELVRHLRPDHTVIDLIKLPYRPSLTDRVEGLCW